MNVFIALKGTYFLIFIIQTDFFETCSNGLSDKAFLLTSKFVPWGLSANAPGLYVLNHEKKMCKIRFQRDLFGTFNKWPKWKVVPVNIKISSLSGGQPLPRANIHV